MKTTRSTKASNKLPRNACGRTEAQQAAYDRRQEEAYRKELAKKYGW